VGFIVENYFGICFQPLHSAEESRYPACRMPYRIDLRGAAADVFDRLVELGAIDIEAIDAIEGVAAIMPDGISADAVARALGIAIDDVRVTPARGRDDESIWVLTPRPVQAGRLRIIPANWPRDADMDADANPDADANTLRMIDGPAFGTGLHPTTALCLEALDDELSAWPPDQPKCVLDVGTGSGVLALAALASGVPSVVAVDIDADAVRVAAENARLNGLSSRLLLVHGGPESLSGFWPLVLANVLSAPLMDMAPILVRRVGRSGRLVLSGIRSSLAADVEQAYRHVGMRLVRSQARDGWTALTLHSSW
jgi:ribosomal protein L11 methyltransferase